MKKELSILILFISVVVAFGSCKQVNEDNRPNILVIMCDDLGYADVGFNGAKDIRTPHLDNLASNGLVFTSAYATHPFCGPSRASFMTGRYAHGIGAQFNLPRGHEANGQGINLEETFISKVLQDAGYHTGAIGKWHLGEVTEYHPNNRGFDDFYGFLGGGHLYFPEQYRAKYDQQVQSGNTEIWNYLTPLEHNGVQVKETEYLTDAFSREAVRFISEAKEKKQPFFLYLAYNAPHSPMEAKESDLALYADIQDEKRRTYAAMVHAVDRGIDQLIAGLKTNRQYDNTLIVFLSDNGGKVALGADNTPLREGKGSAYEGGYRVPMFFHWPEGLNQKGSMDYPVSANDFYATFAALAKADIPEGKTLDGKNIWEEVNTGENPHQDEMIYCLRHRTGYTDVGARKNEWKATRVGMEPWKLFNIAEDKGENNDLSTQHPEILKELVLESEKWSQTHIQPLWWHDEQTGQEWIEMNMPRFDETFSLDR